MARNDEKEFDLDDESGFDIEGFDFDVPEFEDHDRPKKGSRTPVSDLKNSFFKTTKEKLTSPSQIKHFLSLALPKGYAQAINAYDAAKASVEDVYSANQQDLAPFMRQMSKGLNKLSPKVKNTLPKSVRERIEALAQDDEGTADYSQGFAGQDELNRNLEMNAEIFKAQEQGRQEDRAQDLLNEKAEQSRHENQIGAINVVARGIGRLVGYQDNILIKYHKTSLELKYKHLAVSKQMLDRQIDFQGKVISAFENVVHNTALPEAVKIHGSEMAKQMLAQRLTGAALNTVGNFTASYRQQLMGNINDRLSTALGMYGDMSEGAAMAGMSKGQMAGSMLSELLVPLATEFGAEKLSPHLERLGIVKRGNNRLTNAFTGIPQRLNEYAKSETTREGFLGRLEDFGKALLPQFSATASIRGQGLADLDSPATFDNLVYTSITQIMPGYMASMDASLRSLVSGNQEEERGYSHYSGSLVNRSDLNAQNIRIALRDNDLHGAREQVDSVLRQMKAQDLSLDALRVLRKQLLKDMSSGHDFKPARYVRYQTWGSVDPKVSDELVEFFADRFGLDYDGAQADTSLDKESLRTQVRSAYLSASSQVPELGARMQALTKVLGRETFRDAGLTRYNGATGDTLDLDALYELMLRSEIGSRDERDLGQELTEKSLRERLNESFKRKEVKEKDFSAYAPTAQAKVAPAVAGQGLRGAPVLSGPLSHEDRLYDALDSIRAAVEGLPNYERHWENLLERQIDQIQLQEVMADRLVNGIMTQVVGEGQTVSEPSREEGFFTKKARKSWIGRGAKAAASGALGAAKLYGRGTLALYKGIFKSVGLGARLGTAGVRGAFASRNLGVSDIYVTGEDTPSLLAKKLRQGLYFDAKTRKSISRVKDITGPVEDELGNVVLSQEDLDKGLYTKGGESLIGFATRRGLGMAGKAAGLYGRGVLGFYGALFKGVRGAFNLVKDDLTQVDAYLPGEDRPRMRSNLMAMGHYIDLDTKRIIRSLDQVTGDVIDKNGRIVVTKEELDAAGGFVTVSGSKIRAVAGFGLRAGISAAKLGVKLGVGYAKLVGRLYRGGVKGVMAIGRGVGRMLGMQRFMRPSIAGMASGEDSQNLVQIGVHQLTTQVAMLDLLNKRLNAPKPGVRGDVDGDGIRENSWMDRLRRRRAKEGAPAAGAGDADKIVSGVTAAILDLKKSMKKSMDHLADVTEEAGEDGLLDQAADVADVADGIRGEGKGKRGRRARAKRLKTGGGFWSKVKGAGKWVGRGLMAALPFAGEALGAAAGLISAPVVLGAAAVVAVGAAAYFGYKWYKGSNARQYPLFALRMTQYGVEPSNEAQVQKMLALESLFQKGVTSAPDGSFNIDSKQVDVGKVLELFGISPQGQDSQEDRKNLMFYRWLSARFRPVFLAHTAAMMKNANGKDLSQVDQQIKPEQLQGFVDSVNLPGMDKVYDDSGLTFTGSALSMGSSEVKAAVERALAGANNTGQSDKPSGLAGAGSAAGAAASVGVMAARQGSLLQPVVGGETNLSNVSAAGVKRAAGRIGLAAGAAAVSVGGKPSIDVGMAVRYRIYGLQQLEASKCEQIYRLEQLFWPSLKYDDKGNAYSTLDMDKDVLPQAMLIFKPTNTPMQVAVRTWVGSRFIPTLLQYATSVRRRVNGDVQDSLNRMAIDQQMAVLQETAEAKADYQGDTVPVWTVATSPWEQYELNRNPGSIKEFLDVLEQKASKSNWTDSHLLMSAKGQGGEGPTFTPSAIQPLSSSFDSVPSPMATYATGATKAGGGIIEGMKRQSQQDANRPVGVMAGGGTGDGSILKSGPLGNVMKHPGGGTGGDINQIPMPQGKGWAGSKDTLIAAANMVGVDPSMMATTVAIESGFDPNAKAGTSSATGYGQFIGGTWKEMMSKYAAKYGIAPGTSPTDPRANAIMTAQFLKDNAELLSAKLGREVTDTDLYAAHFLGPGGALKLLKANPNTASGDVVGNAVVAANKPIFLTKDGRMRSVAEVYQELDRRVNAKGRKMHDLQPGQAYASAKPTGGEIDTASSSTAASAAQSNAFGAPVTVTSDQPSPAGGSDTLASSGPIKGQGNVAPAAITGGGAAPSIDPTNAPVSSDGGAVQPAALKASPSQGMAQSQQVSRSQQEAATASEMTPLLQEQLVSLKSIDGTLKSVLEAIVQNGSLMKAGADTQQAKDTSGGSSTARGNGNAPVTSASNRKPVDTNRRSFA